MEAQTIRRTSQAVIDMMLSKTIIDKSHRVLEPSAGIGVLADGIARACPEVGITCVELNQNGVDALREKGYDTVHSNFFHYLPDHSYDRIIASPTFKDNVDCNHVRHMYQLLSSGGEIVSLMSPAWMTGDTQVQAEFRQWLQERRYSITMLPDNSFMEGGKTVPTIIIHIQKP